MLKVRNEPPLLRRLLVRVKWGLYFWAEQKFGPMDADAEHRFTARLIFGSVILVFSELSAYIYTGWPWLLLLISLESLFAFAVLTVLVIWLNRVSEADEQGHRLS